MPSGVGSTRNRGLNAGLSISKPGASTVGVRFRGASIGFRHHTIRSDLAFDRVGGKVAGLLREHEVEDAFAVLDDADLPLRIGGDADLGEGALWVGDQPLLESFIRPRTRHDLAVLFGFLAA